ncbi:MAG TPA: periplasmic heavy metal sensor [Pyrinomonadaceae bacterium]|jgi:Spy/CpxP family protein refolding chaperone|nr:periplasmic heavy metal sensor [Pyrinomonadaceae bacterium]
MDYRTKSKWQVRAAAAVIFLLGFVGGSLAFNVYQKWSRARADGGRFEQMLDRLQLSAEQKTQVHQILSDARAQLHELRKQSEPQFEEIRRQTDERLQKVLTPEQWNQFQQERDKRRGRGRRGPRGPDRSER